MTTAPDSGPHVLLPGWQPVYSVNIGIIDRHHMQLFELVGQLHDALRLQKDRTVLDSILNELINRTQAHFTSEEVLMETFGFSGRRQHKIEHDWLIGIVLEFQNLHVSGQAELTVDLMEFMNVWLANHILGMDQRYRKFFADLGAK
jgi:hemerythrin-like metal-binding protein